MKVYFDIITNHTADVIGYEEGARQPYVSKDAAPYRTAAGAAFDDRDYAGTDSFPALSPTTSFPYTPVLDPAEQNLKVPAWLNDVTLYHNRGDTTFTGEDSQYGDFFGLDDLFTENPKVVDGMIDVYKTWIRDFGVDGFRIDTMKHVNDEFWQKFGPEVLNYAQQPGQARVLHVRRGLRHCPKPFTSHFTTQRQDAGRARLPVPGRGPQLRLQGPADRSAADVLRRTTTGTPTPTPTSTSCRPSSATTTWAASAASCRPTTRAPATPSGWPATGWRTS